MSTEPGGIDQAQPRRNRGLWGGIAVCAGAAFGIIALLHAPGIAYAIVARLAYTLTHMYYRRGR